MNILSPAFRRRLTPYLGNKTSHFIHELNNFARSPHDMFGYDSVVQYNPQSNEDVVIEFSSSDDSTDNEIDVAEAIAVHIPEASTNGALNVNNQSYQRVFRSHLNSFAAINLTIHNRLTSNAGRGGDITTGSASGSNTRQVMQDGVNLVIDLLGETEDQSAADAANSRANNDDENNQSTPQVADNIELTSGSSDECEFVLERKPPHLRTPEMVSLDSASDSDVVFVDESKPLSKTTFSTSEGEDDDAAAAARSKRPTTRSKITALVEAKKRNQQSASMLKNESQGSSEMYNVGASTSAALRLSIQRRGDGPRARRSAYCLRNNRSDPDQSHPPRRRGKRLGSESSHSSSSTGSTDSSFVSSSSTSDEEFVASAAQKQNLSSRKRRRMKKNKNSKCNNASKRSATKRKKGNEDEPSDDEDDNGHMGKNFAQVMAIGERLKRQKAKLRKYRPAGASDDEEDSEGENSWRMEAVHEPLRKQQQENVKTKTNLKATERKRKVRRTTQKANGEQECSNDPCGTADARVDNVSAYKNCESSSDESDNLKLIELKSKLITKSSSENLDGATCSNRLQAEHNDANATASQSQNASVSCPESILQTPTSPASTLGTVQTHFFKMEHEDMQSSNENEQHENVGIEDEDENDDAGDEEVDFNDSDHQCHDSSNGEQHENFNEQVEDDLNVNEYSNETTNLPSPMEQEDVEEDPEEQQDDEESQTPLNIHTPLNLSHESHVFDGTSMSTTTTTTDTILNDAAEQISSAAVNFYNPQTTFNTADFADDNTSNSSSSESSVFTTTTTSSSNSSSSNANGFVNYDMS